MHVDAGKPLISERGSRASTSRHTEREKGGKGGGLVRPELANSGRNIQARLSYDLLTMYELNNTPQADSQVL